MQPPYTLPTAHHGYGKTEMLPPPPRKLEAIVKEEIETVRPDSGYTVNGSEGHEQRPYTYQHPGRLQPVKSAQHVDSHDRSISPPNNTPRPLTADSAQTHWQQKAYTTPHRISTDYRPMSAGSNMHSVGHAYSMSGTPSSYYAYANGTTPTHAPLYASVTTPSHAAAYSNGATPTHAPSTNKRLRDIEEEDEDDYCRPSSSHGGEYDGGLKRRKTVREGVENVVRPIATPSALSRSRSMNYQRR